MKHSGILNGTYGLRLWFAISTVMAGQGLDAQFLITSPTYTYTQNFGTSVISAAGTNISSGTANLTGWMYDAALAGEINITGAAPTNTGGRYAYTLNGNSDRKIGARPSGSTNDVKYGILFRNTSGQTIQSFSVSYTGYQLSLGGNTNANINKLTVDYIVSASGIAITAGGGTPIPALDFSQNQFVTTANTGGQGAGYPATTGTAANSGCISVGASIPDNSYLLVRWNDPDDPQNDPHLAIDNVEVIFFTNQTVANNTACSLLPVELLDFSARSSATGNEISWKVGAEERINGYVLERSGNGIDYVQVGAIDLSGSSESVKAYQFIDQAPESELTYYRLSTLEKNGSRRVYKVLSLESAQSAWTCKGFCNGEDLIAEFKGLVPAETRIGLYDLSGRQLLESMVNRSKETLSLQQIPEGIYLVRVTSPGRSEHFKIALSRP